MAQLSGRKRRRSNGTSRRGGKRRRTGGYKRRGRRSAWKRGKGKRSSLAISRGIPYKLRTTMDYFANISNGALYTSAGYYTPMWTFRLNSLYDPDYTGTGHQPRFFDQWSAIYGSYNVYKVRVKVILIASAASTATANDFGHVLMYQAASGDDALSTGADEVARIMEGTRFLKKPIRFNQTPGQRGSVAIMRSTYYPNKSNVSLGDGLDYWTGVATNPTTNNLLHIGYVNSNNVSNTVSNVIRGYIYMKYYVTMTRPKLAATS